MRIRTAITWETGEKCAVAHFPGTARFSTTDPSDFIIAPSTVLVAIPLILDYRAGYSRGNRQPIRAQSGHLGDCLCSFAQRPQLPASAQQQTASDEREKTDQNGSGKADPENRVIMRRLREEMMDQVREGQCREQHGHSAQYVQNSQGSPPRAQSTQKRKAAPFVV